MDPKCIKHLINIKRFPKSSLELSIKESTSTKRHQIFRVHCLTARDHQRASLLSECKACRDREPLHGSARKGR